jgi:hypothetical protein
MPAEQDATTAPRMTIYGWPGPPRDHATAERYREMAEAGFTATFHWFPDNDAQAKALDAAHAAGVKLHIHTPELKSDPEGTVRRFKDHPALLGYHLRDEPSAADFPMLAEWVRRIRAVDASGGHDCYINLFPNYATPQQLGTATYQEHVDRFVAEVDVPFVSFDHYPITTQGVRPEWYENLEIVSAAARRVGKPLWAFTLLTPHNNYYAQPTVGGLRLQAFSDLAYGAQAIQHFTYWQPATVPGGDSFETAPIDLQGKRTPVYAMVQQLNREIQNLAPVFIGAEVLSVSHTAAAPAPSGKAKVGIPPGTTRYKPAAPIRSLTTEGGGCVVSHLANRGGQRYLAVVNRDPQKPVPLDVKFTRTRGVTWRDEAGVAYDVEGTEHRTDIEPGGIRVFGWSAKGR